MKDTYEKCKKVWDGVFAKEDKTQVPEDKKIGNSDLSAGVDWLCDGIDTVLDFGCGNGSLLFYCALRGTKRHLGFDISSEAIKLANRRKEKMQVGEFDFREGDVNSLEKIADSLVDGVILSNIIDNLVPADVDKLLEQVNRILQPNGKLLIKLNPYIEPEQIKEWGIKVIQGNLLDDGLLLLNLKTEEWTRMFERYFVIHEYKDIYYEEHEQYNRLFLLTK